LKQISMHSRDFKLSNTMVPVWLNLGISIMRHCCPSAPSTLDETSEHRLTCHQTTFKSVLITGKENVRGFGEDKRVSIWERVTPYNMSVITRKRGGNIYIKYQDK